MFDSLRQKIATLIAPARQAAVRPRGTRQYQASRGGSLTAGWATSTTSADSELISSLTQLRNRSRALVRDSAYAKRAKVIVQNNVIGAGIGMQAQVMSSRDTLRDDINDAIETAWEKWSCAEYCHTGGTLHFRDFERALMGQVFEAGEVFIRKHYRSFGGSDIPFALELIEAERIADEFQYPLAGVAPGSMVKMGCEMDKFGRSAAWWIRSRHPGEMRFVQGETDMLERVPAEQIIHLRLVERWPQTRGEPWLHAVARKLNDMDGYSEAEIVAARMDAMSVFTIETAEGDNPLASDKNVNAGDQSPTAEKEFVVEPGMSTRLAPGEKFEAHTPKRPNAALDSFMRAMLREVASGTGVSYESLSRDYSQGNYSSSRLALLDDRDLWRVLQQWYIRSVREPLHKEWLQSAVLAGQIPGIGVEDFANNRDKYQAVLFKPRGWSWIKPNEEVEAYIAAIEAGFMTVSDVIAITGEGRDLEDVLRQRARELKMMEEVGIEFTTSPSVYTKKVKGPPTAAPPDNGDGTGGEPKPKSPDDNKSSSHDPHTRVVSFQR